MCGVLNVFSFFESGEGGLFKGEKKKKRGATDTITSIWGISKKGEAGSREKK